VNELPPGAGRGTVVTRDGVTLQPRDGLPLGSRGPRQVPSDADICVFRSPTDSLADALLKRPQPAESR